MQTSPVLKECTISIFLLISNALFSILYLGNSVIPKHLDFKFDAAQIKSTQIYLYCSFSSTLKLFILRSFTKLASLLN